MTQATDPTLTAHIDARNASLPQDWPGIKPEHYLEVVLRERADRYAAHLAAMTITPDLVQWGMAMTRKYGPYVRAWHFICDWFTALLILRYGEENRAYDADAVAAAVAAGEAPPCSTDPAFAGWPLAFSDADRVRAAELLAGTKWPKEGLTLLSTEA